ncbi:MAG: peptidoglycan-binding domain-containing protein [Patescibacteria group bacterium]
MKRLFSIAVLALGFLPFAVFAQNVTTGNDVTLVLPSDGTQYTLKTNSNFDSLLVNNSDFSFTMSAGMYVDIISPDKKKLTNSKNVATECESSQSRVYIALDPGATSQTITVTPSGSCTTQSSGGGGSIGGGGGSGGGGGWTPPAPPPAPPPASPPPAVSTPIPMPPPSAPLTIEEIQAQIVAIMAKIAALRAGQAAPPSGVPATVVARPSLVAQKVSPVFNSGLGRGSRNADVRRLQKLLNRDPDTTVDTTGVGAPGNESDYFGALTERAVQRFQKKYGIAGPGVAGYGYVGPKTRAKLAEVFGGTPVSMEAPASPDARIRSIQQQIQDIQNRINALQNR